MSDRNYAADPSVQDAPFELKTIARIQSDFTEKFGIPRQSGLVPSLKARVIFEPEFRDPNAVKGIEGYSHLWLIWLFSKAVRDTFSPTVIPPRLGGRAHMGVFATRSPFRPNRIGLSCVEIESIESHTERGPIIHVRGIDMMDGTPIFDIKPYIPYCDSIPEARGGFTTDLKSALLNVEDENNLLSPLKDDEREAITAILASDPRPRYHNDENRIYGFEYGAWEIKFSVAGEMVKVIGLDRKKMGRLPKPPHSR